MRMFGNSSTFVSVLNISRCTSIVVDIECALLTETRDIGGPLL